MTTEKPVSKMKLADLVDELGEVKANIADWTERETQLLKELKTRGVEEADGNLFRATISSYDRTTLDKTKLLKALVRYKIVDTIDNGKKWLLKYSHTTLVTTVRVVARNVIGAKKAA